MKQKTIGMLLITLSAASLAYATIVMKLIPELTRMQPQHLAIWRFSIATPMLLFITFIHRRSKRSVPDQPFHLLGLGGVYAVASFSALFALDRLPSSLYVIIVYIYPSLVVIFSLILGKAVPKLYWLGLPLTFLGLFLVTYKFGSTISVDLVGLLITIINALAMAVYLIISEKLLKSTQDKMSSTNWIMAGAMIVGFFMIPFWGIQTPESTVGWILLISFGIIGTLLPILAMNYALQLIGAARSSVIMTLQPILAVLFSTIFLGEELTIQQWIGGGVVLVAIILLQLSADRKSKFEGVPDEK